LNYIELLAENVSVILKLDYILIFHLIIHSSALTEYKMGLPVF